MKRVLTPGVVALAVLAVFAGPAGATGAAGSRAPSATCWNAGEGSFGLTGFLTAAANARGPIVRERASDDKPNEVPHSPSAGPSFEATVSIYFHVISPDGVEGNVPLSTLEEQVDVMNATFGGFEGGAATGFAFTLAGVDRTTNPTWYDAKDTADEQRMKKALHVGGANALNVYTTSGYGFLGFAYFPKTYNSREYIDGIVIDYRSMPGGPYGDRFSLGKTLTHEAGHWLGLYHTFQGGCNANGDYVDDTPAMLVPTSRCPADKDTCPKKPGLDPIHNYMDYSDDSCYTQFTPDQATRMRDQWLFYRAA
jgi:hypothetical protein